MDKFRHECERLLEPGESILLEANASLKLGLLRQQGVGRAFLTDRRLLWLHMAPRPLLFFAFWLHRRMEVRLARIRRFYAGGGVLNVSTEDERYQLRLAKRYLALFNPFAVSEHARTAKEWQEKLKELEAAKAGLDFALPS